MASPSTGPEEDNRARFVATPARLTMIAIVAVVVVALVIILLPRSDIGPPANSGASAPAELPTRSVEPTSTPAPTPEPVAAWTGLTWSDPVTPGFVVHVYDLVPWGDGYVAVGEVEVDATRSEAAFMTSPDGLNWTITEQHDPGIDRYPRHLVILNDELLAFSHRATTEGLIIGAPPGTYHGPLIWSSTDGSIWSLVESPSWEQAWTDARVGFMPDGWDDMQYPITSGLVSVAGGTDGLVAIGNSYSDDELTPVILHSNDGRTWSPVSLPADSISPLLNAVVAYDNGFVLVGAVNAGPRAETATPAAWVSAGGRSWTGTTVDVGPVVGGEFGRVLAGADGLVAWAGARELHTGARFTSSWASSDGLRWSPADAPADWMAADGTRIAALGPTPNLATDPALWPGISQGWVSTDGVEWTSLVMSSALTDFVEGIWVVPDGVVYAGVQSFWFGVATNSP